MSSFERPEPDRPDDPLQEFHDQLNARDEERGGRAVEDESRRRNTFHKRRGENRLKNQLKAISLGSLLIGVVSLIAYFTFDQNAVLGIVAGLGILLAGIAFFAANPEALDEFVD